MSTDPAAPTDLLTAQAYAELRRLARHVRRGSPDPLAQPTSLVHEAWERAARWEAGGQRFASRTHFLVVASRAMRRVLIDRVRSARAEKRGGGRQQVTLQGLADAPRAFDVVALGEALDQLEASSARTARVVELRCFGGLTHPEIAEALGVSERTAAAEWRAGKAYLLARIAN